MRWARVAKTARATSTPGAGAGAGIGPLRLGSSRDKHAAGAVGLRVKAR